MMAARSSPLDRQFCLAAGVTGERKQTSQGRGAAGPDDQAHHGAAPVTQNDIGHRFADAAAHHEINLEFGDAETRRGHGSASVVNFGEFDQHVIDGASTFHAEQDRDALEYESNPALAGLGADQLVA